jgi:hypothetical protein
MKQQMFIDLYDLKALVVRFTATIKKGVVAPCSRSSGCVLRSMP